MGFFAVASFVITVVTTAYSVIQARKAKRKAKRAADARKGFDIAVEGEIGPLPIPYGRANVAGYRVFHQVSSTYNYAATGDLEFLTSGDARWAIDGNELQTAVTATGQISVTLAILSEGGGYDFVPENGVWTPENTYNESVALSGGAATLSRSDNTSDYTIPVQTGREDIFLTSAVVTLTHLPWNSNFYNVYYGADGEELPDPNFTETEHSYRIKSYNSVTGVLTLHPLSNADTSIYYNDNTYGLISNEGSPSLASSESNRRKREFFFVQQAICYKGIENVWYATINDKDYRDVEFGESGRIHVYRQNLDTGTIADPMAAANFPAGSDDDRFNAEFPETAYASMVFKLDRDEPQYQGVPEVVFELEGLRVPIISQITGPYGTTTTVVYGNAYSNNPAEVLYDYLTNSEYGKGLPADELDLESFYNVKQICDEIVEVNGSNILPTSSFLWSHKLQADESAVGKQIKRFEFNGVLDSSRPVRTNIQEILSTLASKATLLWSEGKYKLKMQYPKIHDPAVAFDKGDVVQFTVGESVEVYRAVQAVPAEATPENPASWQYAPIINNNLNLVYWTDGKTSIEGLGKYDPNLAIAYIDDGDIQLEGEISQSWIPLSDRYNYCTVTFPNEEKGFDTDSVSWPDKYTNSPSDLVYQTYLQQDNGIQLEITESIDVISTVHHARAHAEEIVRSSRHEKLLKITVSRKYFYLEPQDLISIDSGVLEIPGVLFLISSIKTNSNGSLDLLCSLFDARTLAWNAPDDEVIDPINPFIEYPVGQANNLLYTANEDVQGNLLRSGTLTWAFSEGSGISYDVRYLPQPANTITVGASWIHIGSTRDRYLDIPMLAPGIVTFTVIARDSYGNIAPEFDMATGVGWPRHETIIGANSLLGSTAAIRAYKWTRDDILGVDPSTLLGWDDGEYDFNGSLLTPPVAWYADPNIAYDIAIAEYDPSTVVGNLFYIEATVSTTYPETLVEEIIWSNVRLVDSSLSSHTLTAYYRTPPGATSPSTPGDPNGSDGSFFFGLDIFTPPFSNGGTYEWTAVVPEGEGLLYKSQAEATVPGIYGLNTNNLNWTTPVIVGDEPTISTTTRLFIWSETFPNASDLTSVSSNYQWNPSRAHGALLDPLNRGWELTLPPAPNGAQSRVRAYEARLFLEVAAGTENTSIDWADRAGDGEVFFQAATEGTQTEKVYIYRWEPTGGPPPTTPLSASVFNWNSGVLDSVPAGWSQGVPVAPSNAHTLYRLGGLLTEAANVSTTTISWTAPFFAMEIISSVAAASAFASYAFKRATSAPATPSGGNYASPLPNPLDGWSDGIPGGTIPVYSSKRIFTVDGSSPQDASWSTPALFAQNGDTREFQFSDDPSDPPDGSSWVDEATADTIWMRTRLVEGGVAGLWSAPIRIKGEAGAPGDSGAYTRTAYAIAPLGLSPENEENTSTGEANYPANNAWGMSEVWSGTQPVIPVNHRLWMTIGTHDPATTITTWGKPFWASLTVGSLSAISVNTGVLSVTGDITVSGGSIKSGKTFVGDSNNTGFIFRPDGGFHLGLKQTLANPAEILFDPTAGIKLRIKGRLSSWNYDYPSATGWLLGNENTEEGVAYFNKLVIRDPINLTGGQPTVVAKFGFGTPGADGLRGSYIKDLSVDTLQLANNAITVPRYATFWDAPFTLTPAGANVINFNYQLTLPPGMSSAPVLIMCVLSAYPSGSSSATVLQKVKVNNNIVTDSAEGFSSSAVNLTSLGSINLPAGSHSIKVHLSAGAGHSNSTKTLTSVNVDLIVLGAKR